MVTRKSPIVLALSVATSLLVATGCLPQSKAPEVKGTLGTNKAAQLQSKIRSSNTAKFSVPHKYNDQEFTANWELSNSLKKASQLQMKPPADWTDADLYQALEIVLNAHETKPWYGKIDDTVLKLMREASRDDNGLAFGYAPDTPYEVQVKVKQHTSEWFLEVKVQILEEDGTAIGF
jgi:hypothetical protein